MQEQAKGENALSGAGELGVNVFVDHRREHFEPLFGTADQHVESAFAAIAAKRAEPHRHASARHRRVVADRDEDHVPLVPLDVFEVLHEERLGVMRLEECLRLGRQRASQQLINDRATLGRGEGGHTERQVGVVAGMSDDRLRNNLGLDHVGARSARIEDAVCDVMEAQPHARFGSVGARNDEQIVFVELPVADRDSRLVLAAIMPAQHPHRQAARREQA